jgi:outer membrane cobalamin receptor
VFAKEDIMIKSVIFLFVFLLCFFPLLFPDSKYDDAQPVSHPSFIEEIVVEGEVVSKTATVTTITAKEIHEKGVKNVAEALELIPGSYIRVGGSGEAYIRIRGFRQREIALLIDGIPISSPYNGQLDLSSLPVNTIDRIEVARGASSLMYGPNTMGGVINIITKKSNGASGFSMNSKYGSGGTGEVGAILQGGIGSLRYMVASSYFNQDDYPLSGNYEEQENQDSGDRANSDRKIWNSNVNLGWDMGEKSRATFHFSYLDQVRGLPHHDSDSKAKFRRYTNWQQGMADFIFDTHLGKSSLKAKVYYEYLNHTLDNFDDMTYSTQDKAKSTTENMNNYALGGDLFYRYNVNERLLLKSALRFRYDQNKSRFDLEDSWEDHAYNMFSIPIEVEWIGSDLVTIVGGASFDRMNFDKGQDLGSRTSNSFNPQLALMLSPLKNLSFKATASHKTRFPTIKELFSLDTGNPDLEPMKADIFELGADWRINQKWSVSLVGFYNNVTDLIGRSGKNDPYENIDHAVFKGFETGLEWNNQSGIILKLFYTYLEAIDKSPENSGYIEHRPRHKIDTSVAIKFPARFYISADISYVSSQIYYSDDEEIHLEPYTLLDISLIKKVGRFMEFFVTVRNLFDEDYYESEGYPREGRMILAGFRLTQ